MEWRPCSPSPASHRNGRYHQVVIGTRRMGSCRITQGVNKRSKTVSHDPGLGISIVRRAIGWIRLHRIPRHGRPHHDRKLPVFRNLHRFVAIESPIAHGIFVDPIGIQLGNSYQHSSQLMGNLLDQRRRFLRASSSGTAYRLYAHPVPSNSLLCGPRGFRSRGRCPRGKSDTSGGPCAALGLTAPIALDQASARM